MLSSSAYALLSHTVSKTAPRAGYKFQEQFPDPFWLTPKLGQKGFASFGSQLQCTVIGLENAAKFFKLIIALFPKCFNVN